MDYVTRQFINLAKKLRDDVRKGLTVLHGDFEKQTKIVSKQIERENRRQHSTERLLEQPIKVEADIHEQKATQEANRNRHYQSLGLQALIAIGTWLAFVAAAYYAGVAKDQLGEMIKARKQTHEAIEIAKRSAAAAEASNMESADRFRRDERPYVGLDFSMEPPPGVARLPSNAGQVIGWYNNVYSWSFHYKNFGKSPAINLTMDKHIALGKDAFKQVHWTPIESQSGIVMPPGADFYATASSNKISDQEAKLDHDNDRFMVVYGHIEYESLDGGSYWTEFCFYHFASMAVAWCPTHNIVQ